jgi:hypothetical protein
MQVLVTLSLNFEGFCAGTLSARLKYKNVQKVDSIVLWIQMNFYPNPSGITSQETFLASLALTRVAKNPLFEVIYHFMARRARIFG